MKSTVLMKMLTDFVKIERKHHGLRFAGSTIFCLEQEKKVLARIRRNVWTVTESRKSKYPSNSMRVSTANSDVKKRRKRGQKLVQTAKKKYIDKKSIPCHTINYHMDYGIIPNMYNLLKRDIFIRSL